MIWKRLPIAAAYTSCLLLELVTMATANTTNRIYIKQNGNIAFAIDPSGNIFSRSNNEYEAASYHTGLQFKHAGIINSAIREFSASASSQFGKIIIGGGYYYENFATVPYQPTGSLVFSYQATPTSTKIGLLELDHTDGSADIRGFLIKDFGYRKSTANLKPPEKQNIIDSWLCLDANRFYPGSPGSSNPPDPNAVGSVSYWDKQDQIHRYFGQHSDYSFNPAFLPWHREYINGFESNLRNCDPLVSLPYWDWTTSPANPAYSYDGIALVTWNFPGWFGSGYTRVGSPFNSFDNAGTITGSREGTLNPADPPTTITRNIGPGGSPGSTTDDYVISLLNFAEFASELTANHNLAHNFLGFADLSNNIVDLKRAAQDPIFFLVHSNCDRIWAQWQMDPSHPERLSVETVYGYYSNQWPTFWPLATMMGPGHPMGNENVDPWSGGPSYPMGVDPPVKTPLRPWTSPENQQVIKSYVDPSIINPHGYEDIYGSIAF